MQARSCAQLPKVWTLQLFVYSNSILSVTLPCAQTTVLLLRH